MTTKSELPGTPKAKRTPAARKTSKSTSSSVPPTPHAAPPGKKAQMPQVDRRTLVLKEAYFLAERRGFQSGHELEDWVTAENMVEARLQQTKVA